jgi:predicted ATP-dependent serine protease
MEDEFKLRYACPGCGAKIRIKSGHCPKCGFIGPMINKDIRLRATDAYGRTVTVNPPTVQSEAGAPKTGEGAKTTSQYKCPRCGAKASKAFGDCPNRKSCGYVGPMQGISNGTKPKSK